MHSTIPRSGRREFLTVCAATAIGAIAWRTLGDDSNNAFAATSPPLRLTDAQWRARLSPQAFAVLRKAATERPYTSPLLQEHRPGLFLCAGCALPLFASATKFDSGTGWPSFSDHMPAAITTIADRTLGMQRTEVNCARCAGHLGHVFKDGPQPTGLRYCMNGVAMRFEKS